MYLFSNQFQGVLFWWVVVLTSCTSPNELEFQFDVAPEEWIASFSEIATHDYNESPLNFEDLVGNCEDYSGQFFDERIGEWIWVGFNSIEISDVPKSAGGFDSPVVIGGRYPRDFGFALPLVQVTFELSEGGFKKWSGSQGILNTKIHELPGLDINVSINPISQVVYEINKGPLYADWEDYRRSGDVSDELLLRRWVSDLLQERREQTVRDFLFGSDLNLRLIEWDGGVIEVNKSANVITWEQRSPNFKEVTRNLIRNAKNAYVGEDYVNRVAYKSTPIIYAQNRNYVDCGIQTSWSLSYDCNEAAVFDRRNVVGVEFDAWVQFSKSSKTFLIPDIVQNWTHEFQGNFPTTLYPGPSYYTPLVVFRIPISEELGDVESIGIQTLKKVKLSDLNWVSVEDYREVWNKNRKPKCDGGIITPLDYISE